jgi:hypothetical protein
VEELMKPRFSTERRGFLSIIGHIGWTGLFLMIWLPFLTGCKTVNSDSLRYNPSNIEFGDGYIVKLGGDNESSEEEALGQCVSTHLEKIFPGLRFINSAEFRIITIPNFHHRFLYCRDFIEIYGEKGEKQNQFPEDESLQKEVPPQDGGNPNTNSYDKKDNKIKDEIDLKSLAPEIQLFLKEKAPSLGLRYFICVSKIRWGVVDSIRTGGIGPGVGFGKTVELTGHIFDIKRGLHLGYVSVTAKDEGAVVCIAPGLPIIVPAFYSYEELVKEACQRFGEEIAKFFRGDSGGETSTRSSIPHKKEGN